MPKQRITKEMVVQAAFEIAREEGMEGVLLKRIAERLHCSVQPVYGYCQSMESLRREVVARTEKFFQEFLSQRIDPQNRFKSTGLAHAQLAKEEPYLYRLYFLRDRGELRSFSEIYQQETDPKVALFIADTLGIAAEEAQRLHLHMMIYNVGMSFILSALGSNGNPQEAETLLGEAYRAFLKGYAEKETKE